MKKIAIIPPFTRPVPPIKGGGVQIGIWEIVKHFKHFKPLVFSISDESLPEYMEENGAAFYHIDVNKVSPLKRFIRTLSIKDYVYYIYEISKVLNKEKPDVVHVRTNPAFIAPLKRFLKYKPKICLQHHTSPFNAIYKNWEIKSIFKQIDLFTAVSQHTVNKEVLRRLPELKSKCKVNHNGINPDQFFPVESNHPNRVEIRNNLGVKDDELLIFFVGQIRYIKGINSVVDAFKELLPKYKKIKLLIIGSASGGKESGNEKQLQFFEEFNKKIDGIKNIIHLHFVSHDDLHKYYQASDIACMPSIYEEPFGLVMAESMATGLPLVTSNRGGIPEFVGEAGFITSKPEESAEIRDYLEKLIIDKDLRKSLGEKARDRIANNFTWKHTAERTEKMFLELLEK